MKFLTTLAAFAAITTATSSFAAEKVTLSLWTFSDWTTGTQGDELKRQIAAFEQANPDIRSIWKARVRRTSLPG